MKNFRLSTPDGRESTGAGCLLVLVSAIVGMAGGIPLALWLAAMTRATTGTGVIAIPVAILPSLVLFFVGSAVLEALNIPVWKQAKRKPSRRKPRGRKESENS